MCCVSFVEIIFKSLHWKEPVGGGGTSFGHIAACVKLLQSPPHTSQLCALECALESKRSLCRREDNSCSQQWVKQKKKTKKKNIKSGENRERESNNKLFHGVRFFPAQTRLHACSYWVLRCISFDVPKRRVLRMEGVVALIPTHFREKKRTTSTHWKMLEAATYRAYRTVLVLAAPFHALANEDHHTLKGPVGSFVFLFCFITFPTFCCLFSFFLLSFCCLFLKHHNFSHTSPVCCRKLSASDKAKVLTVYFIHFPPTHPPTNRFAACSLVLFFVLPQEFWSVRLVVVCVCCLCVCVCVCLRSLFIPYALKCSSGLPISHLSTWCVCVCVCVCAQKRTCHFWADRHSETMGSIVGGWAEDELSKYLNYFHDGKHGAFFTSTLPKKKKEKKSLLQPF